MSCTGFPSIDKPFCATSWSVNELDSAGVVHKLIWDIYQFFVWPHSIPSPHPNVCINYTHPWEIKLVRSNILYRFCVLFSELKPLILNYQTFPTDDEVVRVLRSCRRQNMKALKLKKCNEKWNQQIKVQQIPATLSGHPIKH